MKIIWFSYAKDWRLELVWDHWVPKVDQIRLINRMLFPNFDLKLIWFFDCHKENDHEVLICSLKGITIKFTIKSWAKPLKIPNTGVELYKDSWYASTYVTRSDVISLMVKESEPLVALINDVPTSKNSPQYLSLHSNSLR